MTDGREEQPNERRGAETPAPEPPRPEIDAGLLGSLVDEDEDPVAAPAEVAATATEPSVAEPDDAWAQAAEVLEAVPEPSVAAEPNSEAAPVADVEEDDETLAVLRAIPLRQRVEALLFAASEPISLARLRTLVAARDPVELRRVLDGLAAEYAQDGRAFTFQELAGGIQLRTLPEVAPVVARLGRRREMDRLSPAALETLAIVAYRQPVLRADVEKIRGVASGEVLRTLVERGLVRVAGRAELPGSPLLYGTTPRFLEVFGLRNLRDLPSDEQLLRRPAGD